MRAIAHRLMIPRRPVPGSASVQPSASRGSAAPASPRPSTGTAKIGGHLPPTFAGPVLIHRPPKFEFDDGDAETPGVLLLDGPPGTAFVWHRVMPVLRCCGVIPGAVKRPGRPGGAGPIEDAFGAATDIAQLLDDQQHPPAVVVAHGLDNNVALALAATAPRRVRALVLIGPAGGLQSISIIDRLLSAPILGPLVTCLAFRGVGLALHLPALRQGVLIKRAGVKPHDAKSLVREITFGTMWRNFVREQRRLAGDARERNRQLANIDCPVVIVAGSRDGSVASRPGRAQRRLLPRAEVVATDASWYQVPIEDPDSVVDAVLLALRRDYQTRPAARI